MQIHRSYPSCRWKPRPAPGLHLQELPAEYDIGLPQPVAMLMARRGLPPKPPAPLESLFETGDLPGAEDAVHRLRRAAESGERELVHGDYDVDGITATVIMVRALRAAGARPAYHIPHRIDEGYGLGDEGVQAALKMEAGLLVTVDCGTNAVEEVEELARKGVDALVTDHHQPDDRVAPALSIVNPALEEDQSASWSGLSGAGVALALAEGLLGDSIADSMGDHLLGLAALGTVCDMVPLSGDNRIIARQGIAALRRQPLPGIAALTEAGGRKLHQLTEQELAFVIGPRLNSCGRLSRADLAVDLLLEDDLSAARAMAAEIESLNRKRKRIGDAIWTQVRDHAEEPSNRRVLIMGNDGWHRGVVGIACSRAARRYGLPTILVAFDGEMGYGSARSVRGISIHSLLEESSDLLEGFGGHHMAAGLRIRRDNIRDLEKRLESALAARSKELFGPTLLIDGRLRDGELSIETLTALESLRPFGQGNPEPVWISRRVRAQSVRLVGSRRSHLSCSFSLGKQSCRAIGFGMANAAGLLSGPVDVAYRLQRDAYRGGDNVQMVLEGVRRAAGNGG